MAERTTAPLLITLIRHAAAQPESRGGDDFERVLSPVGEREAARMAKRLRASGFAPDRIAASSARRTSQTADVIAAEIGYPLARIERSDDLYLAGDARLAAWLSEADDRARHIALVGHNPGVSDLWEWLIEEPGGALPTCGVARFQLDVSSWRELMPGGARLLDFDFPDRVAD